MDIFSNLKEYELLELQEDLKTIFIIKKIIIYVIQIMKKLKKLNIIKVYLNKYQMNLKIQIYNFMRYIIINLKIFYIFMRYLIIN